MTQAVTLIRPIGINRGSGPRIKSGVGSGAGFTLIEIIVVIGLLSMIAALGLFISMDFYKSYAFRSERSTIVSVLQKARSQSMDNIDQQRHGVHFFLNGGKLTYRLFECPSTCTAYQSSSQDLDVAASYNIGISPALPFDVVFDQLNGNCVVSSSATPFNCDPLNQPITVTDSGKTYSITVNSVGQIDW